jgi:hypothetical protein
MAARGNGAAHKTADRRSRWLRLRRRALHFGCYPALKRPARTALRPTFLISYSYEHSQCRFAAVYGPPETCSRTPAGPKEAIRKPCRPHPSEISQEILDIMLLPNHINVVLQFAHCGHRAVNKPPHAGANASPACICSQHYLSLSIPSFQTNLKKGPSAYGNYPCAAVRPRSAALPSTV